MKEIIDKFRRKTKLTPADAQSPITAADFQIQDFGMKYCGQLALYILYKLNRKEDFLKTVLELV